MAHIGADEITKFLRGQIEDYDKEVSVAEIGTIMSLGDGIAQGDASPTEMRTSPLWGLRSRTTYLHDGRATTVDAAIRAHAGEGAGSAEAYAKLSPVEQQQLLAFLNSL